MEIIAKSPDKTVTATTIDRPFFSPPLQGVLFPCLIWDHTGEFSHQQRRAVAGLLIEAGCRYVVCGGLHAEAWHDAVDMEFVSRHLDEPDEARGSVHVMTTWHEGESPDTVASFFVLHTNFGHHGFRHYLVLHVGTGPGIAPLEAAIRRHVGGSGDVMNDSG
jgi:hypothetical protein